jgi:phosphoribosylformylglycinamidine synthase
MNPEIFWQLKKCVEGIRDACLAFETPVSGGNVSLYNQNPKGAIDPTPVIGMVGLIEGYEPVTSHFKNEGDIIVLLGESKEELGGSEYLKTIFNVKSGKIPQIDLKAARKLTELLVVLSQKGLIQSAHDCAEGGLAVTLAESCVHEKGKMIGASIDDKIGSLSNEAYLFGETQSRAVISVNPKNLKAVHEEIVASGVPHKKIGEVGGTALKINSLLQIPIIVLANTWRNAIKTRMES